MFGGPKHGPSTGPYLDNYPYRDLGKRRRVLGVLLYHYRRLQGDTALNPKPQTQATSCVRQVGGRQSINLHRSIGPHPLIPCHASAGGYWVEAASTTATQFQDADSGWQIDVAWEKHLSTPEEEEAQWIASMQASPGSSSSGQGAVDNGLLFWEAIADPGPRVGP